MQIHPEEAEDKEKRQHAHPNAHGKDRPEDADIIELAHPQPILDIARKAKDDEKERDNDRDDP